MTKRRWIAGASSGNPAGDGVYGLVRGNQPLVFVPHDQRAVAIEIEEITDCLEVESVSKRRKQD